MGASEAAETASDTIPPLPTRGSGPMSHSGVSSPHHPHNISPPSIAPPAGFDADDYHDDLFRTTLKNAPPWLISAIVHMLVMILLALMILPQILDSKVELEATFSDTIGEQDLYQSDFADVLTDEVEQPLITPRELPEVSHPIAEPLPIDDLPGFHRSGDPVVAMGGVAFDGRQPGNKEILLGRFGGTKTTQEAVQAGLRWLARNQHAGGSWSLVRPYSDGGRTENREVATAMALLAFQGDGNTTEFGPYKEKVKQGWYYLLKQQDKDGCFFREGASNHRAYTQGFATIALCELYAMTSDPALKASYREPAAKAIDYCIRAQSSEGGWRYQPMAGSDLSVTGWILMALQSARMAGIVVPKETLDDASRYLDAVGHADGSRYCYQPGREPTRTMTAEGLLCRQYLGWQRDDPSMVDGVEWLLRKENELSYTSSRDVYHWYYATQVLHHMEGEPWQQWNRRMCELVPAAQVKKGREEGSWDPNRPTVDRRAGEGGRLYVTCLSIYMLEVYYRHMPLYSVPF